MAFTFLFLSLFSWCVYFYFFFPLEIPNTFSYSHFQLTLHFPALLMGTAGWSWDGAAEPVSVLLPHILQTASILDFLSGFSTGRAAKLGPWGKLCPPCTALLFLLSSKIFRGRKCRFVLVVVSWWPERPWKNGRARGNLLLCPCPPSLSGSSLPPRHISPCIAAEGTLKSRGLTGLVVQSKSPLSAAAVSAAWGADLPISVEPCRDTEIALNEHSHELVFIPKCDTVIYICQCCAELPCSLWTLSSKMFQANAAAIFFCQNALLTQSVKTFSIDFSGMKRIKKWHS